MLWTKIFGQIFFLGSQIFRTQTFFEPQIFSVVGWGGWGGGLQSDFHVKLNFGWNVVELTLSWGFDKKIHHTSQNKHKQ